MKIKALILSIAISFSLTPTPVKAYTKNDLQVIQACAGLTNLIGLLTKNSSINLTSCEVSEIMSAALENESQDLAIGLLTETLFALMGSTSIHSYSRWLQTLSNQPTWFQALYNQPTEQEKEITVIASILRILVRVPLVTLIKNNKQLRSNRFLKRTLRASLFSLSSIFVGLFETYTFNQSNQTVQDAWKNFGTIAVVEFAINCINEALGELVLEGTDEAQLIRNQSQPAQKPLVDQQPKLAPVEAQ